MQANVQRTVSEFSEGGRITLQDVAVFSGEELVTRFGPSAPQQLVDLIVAAIRKGDDDEVAAIDGRLQEVERIKGASLPGGAPPGREG